MKYRLPRQVISKKMHEILLREMKKQKIDLARLSSKGMKELLRVCNAVKKEGLPKNFICKKLDKDLGHGIFLHPEAKPIPKGAIIGPYAGEVTFIPQNIDDDGAYAFTPIEKMYLTKEEQKTYDPKRKFQARRQYLMKVDALKNGNFCRFINHSEKPNVEARMLCIPENHLGLTPSLVEVVYVAKKKILPGEQLLVCYEDGEETYWGVYDIKPYPMNPRTFMLDKSLKLISKK